MRCVFQEEEIWQPGENRLKKPDTDPGDPLGSCCYSVVSLRNESRRQLKTEPSRTPLFMRGRGRGPAQRGKGYMES